MPWKGLDRFGCKSLGRKQGLGHWGSFMIFLIRFFEIELSGRFQPFGNFAQTTQMHAIKFGEIGPRYVLK